jgi:hypothetical protein
MSNVSYSLTVRLAKFSRELQPHAAFVRVLIDERLARRKTEPGVLQVHG